MGILTVKINYIEAQNFRSYKYFKFNLDNKGLILVKGQASNTDENVSNGAGKTSIFYALLYALYGETADGAKGDEVINNKVGKECFTRVEFSHFNHTYEVTRYRKDKDYKNKTIVKRDSKDITLSTNKETDKEIISILGFGFDTMLNSMVFSPEKLNTFVSATDKQRKAMLEELTNTNIYKQAQSLVKIDRDTDAQSLQESLNKQQQVNTLLDSQRALKAQYEQNKASHDQQIKSLKERVKELGTVDRAKLEQLKLDYQHAQTDLATTAKSLQALTIDMNVDTSKSSNLQQKLNQLTYEQNKLKQQVADLLNKAKELATSKDAVCSWCGSVLDKEHKQLEMSNIKKQATTLAQQYASYDKPINATKNELAKAQQEEDRAKQRAKNKQQLYQDESDKRNQLSITVTQLKNDLNNLQAKSVQVQNAKAQLAQLQAQKIEEPTLTISKLELEAGQLGEKIKKLQKKQDEYKDLIQIYSDKGVKAQALSAVIPFLNQELKSILKVLTNDTMSASLSNHTKTKSGKVNNQISLLIDSAVSGSNYQDLSSGEKRRIGIALNIAFMSYLKSQIGGLNLAVFDEVFDNLDTEGIDQVIQVLNKLKSDIPNILIISHNNDLNFNDQIDSKLLVKKIDNFSKIIDN